MHIAFRRKCLLYLVYKKGFLRPTRIVTEKSCLELLKTMSFTSYFVQLKLSFLRQYFSLP